MELFDGSSKLIAKSVEHDVLFPKDCAGKRARVRGLVRVSREKHEGGDGCPDPKVLVEILGAELR